ncbi:MAG: hypothetical protein ACI3XQ_01865 [Eubacteriales bacterium]
MTAFVYSHGLIFRGTFFMLSVTALLGIICFAMSTSYRLKLRYIIPEFVASVAAIVFFSCLFDGILIRDIGRSESDFAKSFCMMPTWIVVLIILLLFAVVATWFALVIKKRLSSLTAFSVKEALALLPCGLCFYDETGRLLLMNEQMDRECRNITGSPLSDGAKFWSDICESRTLTGVAGTRTEDSVIVEQSDGRVNCYRRTVHDFGNKKVFELSGTDISREFAMKKELEERNEKLRCMNERLRKYGDTVTQVTRESETLAARVRIHDGMGALILTTKKALSHGEYDRRELLSMWDNIVSVIYTPDSTMEDKYAEAEKTAQYVGVEIIYSGVRLPEGSVAKKILASAMFECITNTARHANGDRVYVDVTDNGDYYSAVLTNSGNPPEGPITEGGGLSSLRTLVENSGGSMTTESDPNFRLIVCIPGEVNEHER